MKFRILNILVALVLLMPCLTSAEVLKEYKELKSCIKSSNINRGREIIKKCLSDTLFNADPEFYSMAFALEKKANDAENMKLYLKQNYDTAAFFNSVYNMFEYSAKHDLYLEKAGDKNLAKFRKQRSEFMKPYYQNLYNGGTYFVKKKNWKSAAKLFGMYIETTTLGYIVDDNPQTFAKLPRAAFWSMSSCYENKDYKGALKFKKLAEADSANINYILQYEALSYEQLKDTQNYVSALKNGLQVTSSEFFFSRLTDYYNSIHDYKSAYLLNDSLLKVDSTSMLYLYAQTIALFNMKEYDKCIQNTEKILKRDPEHIQANYYLGICWYNKGQEYDKQLVPNPTSSDFKKRMDEVNMMFKNAMPYLEKFRKNAPKEKEKWQAPLYRIYFCLNMSDKLMELEKE